MTPAATSGPSLFQMATGCFQWPIANVFYFTKCFYISTPFLSLHQRNSKDELNMTPTIVLKKLPNVDSGFLSLQKGASVKSMYSVAIISKITLQFVKDQ